MATMEMTVNPEVMVPLAPMLNPDNKQLLPTSASPVNLLLLAQLVHLDLKVLLEMLEPLDNLLDQPWMDNLDLLVLLDPLVNPVDLDNLVLPDLLDKFKMFPDKLALLVPLALLDNLVNLDNPDQAALDNLDHLVPLEMLVPLVLPDMLELLDNVAPMEIPEVVENVHTVLHQELHQVIKGISCIIFAFIYCHENRKPFNNRKNLRSFILYTFFVISYFYFYYTE
jgi:hypothetical protein